MPITLTTPEAQDDWNAVKIGSFKVDVENNEIIIVLLKGVFAGATPLFTAKSRVTVAITGDEYDSVISGTELCAEGYTVYDVNKEALYDWLEANGYAGTH